MVELAPQLREFGLHLPHLLSHPFRCSALVREAGERLLPLSAETREFRCRRLLRRRSRLLAIVRGGELDAEFFEFRLEHRIRQQALAVSRETCVLLLQFLEGTLGIRELPRKFIARLQRRGVLRLDLRRDLLASRDLTVEADIDRLLLRAQPVALDDQRLELPFERCGLLTQRARELLPLLEDRLALAVEFPVRLRVLHLERLILLAQGGHIAAPHTVSHRVLQFANLRVLRLRGLLERSDARCGFREPLGGFGMFLLALAGQLRRGVEFLLRFPRRLFLFHTRGVALLHQQFQAGPIFCDFHFQPIHRPLVENRRLVRRSRRLDEPHFEFRRADARVLEIGVDRFVMRVKRVHLHLEILQRLAQIRIALFHARFDILPHLLLRGLHVVRGLHLPLVGGGEKFFRLQPRLHFAREFLRRFLLRLFEGLDPAVQFVHEPIGFPLRTRRLRHINSLRTNSKFSDLSLELFDFLMLRIELLLHLLALLRGTAGEFRADGNRRVPFRDLIQRILQIPAQIPGLGGGTIARLDQRLALLFQIHELPLVIAAEHRDATLDVSRQIAEL